MTITTLSKRLPPDTLFCVCVCVELTDLVYAQTEHWITELSVGTHTLCWVNIMWSVYVVDSLYDVWVHITPIAWQWTRGAIYIYIYIYNNNNNNNGDNGDWVEQVLTVNIESARLLSYCRLLCLEPTKPVTLPTHTHTHTTRPVRQNVTIPLTIHHHHQHHHHGLGYRALKGSRRAIKCWMHPYS